MKGNSSSNSRLLQNYIIMWFVVHSGELSGRPSGDRLAVTEWESSLQLLSGEPGWKDRSTDFTLEVRAGMVSKSGSDF